MVCDCQDMCLVRSANTAEFQSTLINWVADQLSSLGLYPVSRNSRPRLYLLLGKLHSVSVCEVLLHCSTGYAMLRLRWCEATVFNGTPRSLLFMGARSA